MARTRAKPPGRKSVLLPSHRESLVEMREALGVAYMMLYVCAVGSSFTAAAWDEHMANIVGALGEDETKRRTLDARRHIEARAAERSIPA